MGQNRFDMLEVNPFQAAGEEMNSPANEPAPKGDMKRFKMGNVKENRLIDDLDSKAGNQPRKVLLHEIIFVLQEPGFQKEPFSYSGVVLFEERNQLVPNSIASINRRLVRGIFHMRNVVSGELSQDLFSTDFKERTDDPAPHFRNGPQSFYARAPEKMHQERFRLIVGGMSQSDPTRADRFGRFF